MKTVCFDRTLRSMEQQSIPISRDAIYCLLKACDNNRDIRVIRRIQSVMAEGGLDSVAVLGDHLIRLYTACGSLPEANHAFCKIKEPTEYTWSSIISANTKLGEGKRALSIYCAMIKSNVKSNRCIYICALKACSVSSTHVEGMLIHGQIIESEMETDVVIGSALIDMYGKCSRVEEAHAVFDRLPEPNLVSWNTIIAGYASQGEYFQAIQTYERMQHEGIEPDKATLSSILKVCSSLEAADYGMLIHDQIIQTKLESDVIVGSCLMHMYANCGSLSDAQRVFDGLPCKDSVTWRTIMAGYTFHGYDMPAIKLSGEGDSLGMCSNFLKTCSSIGAVDQGRMIHDHIIRNAADVDEVIGSALIDMYSKCGNLDEARKVLEDLPKPKRNVVCWGALIAGHAKCADFKKSEQCLHNMRKESCKPNDMVMSSVLTAYAKMGFVDEGKVFFHSMKENYGIVPSNEHYVCMVDLLGRTGHLMEAEDLLRRTVHNLEGWVSLLFASKLHGKVDIARHSFEQIVLIDPQLSAAYELMSDVYEKAWLWKDAELLQSVRKHKNVWKKPGIAWIELNNEVHRFIVGDMNAQQGIQISLKQKNLRRIMWEHGYQPQLTVTDLLQ